jgi:hypothetical protein
MRCLIDDRRLAEILQKLMIFERAMSDDHRQSRGTHHSEVTARASIGFPRKPARVRAAAWRWRGSDGAAMW